MSCSYTKYFQLMLLVFSQSNVNVLHAQNAGWCYRGSKMYLPVTQNSTYQEASRYCRYFSSHVARPTSVDENRLLIDLLPSGVHIWIDAIKIGSGFRWSDGSAINWSYWTSYQGPTDPCVKISKKSGRWLDKKCTYHEMSVCERLAEETKKEMCCIPSSRNQANWHAWSACTSQCGGTRTRVKSCEPTPRGSTCCQGFCCWGATPTETQTCNNCPVDGAWTNWASWSRCSSVCGGYKTRSRTCSNPAPKFNGRQCPGGATDKAWCNACSGNTKPVLTPQLHMVQPAILKTTSWYDVLESSDHARACFIKVDIENAPSDTYFAAVSKTTTNTNYGNFTVGPSDEHLHFTGSRRTACLQFRCPSTLHPSMRSTKVVIYPFVSHGTCKVRFLNSNLTSITPAGSNYGQQILEFTATVNDKYGPEYGIYIGSGKRTAALSLGTYRCLSGSNNPNVITVKPGEHSAVKYVCS